MDVNEIVDFINKKQKTEVEKYKLNFEKNWFRFRIALTIICCAIIVSVSLLLNYLMKGLL